MQYVLVIFVVIMLEMSHTLAFPAANNDPNYSFKFYSREDWEAAPGTGETPLNTPVPYVVIHHTAIPAACYTKENCTIAMKAMQNYHKSLNWGDIGYNFCVGSDGAAYEGRGWHEMGIHAKSANRYSIGICLIGDWRYELPPVDQLKTTKALISEGVKRGVISSKYKMIGHMQVSPTECPGTMLYNEISTWDHFTPGSFSGVAVDH